MKMQYFYMTLAAIFVFGALYIGYSLEQDYRWGIFMDCVAHNFDVKVCNIINFRDTSVYAPPK